jgi:hypothetical protein
METLIVSGDQLGARLTAEVAGSFGILQYALLAFARQPGVSGNSGAGQTSGYSLTEEMLDRGFKRACNGDYADIALKAQPADGSIQCRVSIDGFVSLWTDNHMVWSERFDAEDEASALWLKAARNWQVTLISGDHLRISETGVDPRAAANKRALVMAKIPTVWT